MKCELCGKGLATTFLGKIKGTYFRDAKGKQRVACFECQSKFRSRDALLQQIR